MENPIKLDDVGVPLFSETSKSWQLKSLGIRVETNNLILLFLVFFGTQFGV